MSAPDGLSEDTKNLFFILVLICDSNCGKAEGESVCHSRTTLEGLMLKTHQTFAGRSESVVEVRGDETANKLLWF